ncbi:MAG: DNA polymerase III subunit gamma/tau [Candidatus Omnitrophica bacterium]|nr:DNA polymerase III subunit gamma/tau [Candidatus Omnitrophota bacterium]
MSYTVFALTWRPKHFDEIVGQAHIVATLKNALQNNRLAHAYLFAGPRGVGKTSTARILAKALNCAQGPTINPCQACSSCQQISEGRSLDVIEIDGASNNGVDNIRELRESVKFAPASGKYKIYIIDEVHMLSDSAFNALLKTLEEPPPYVKFIFATTHPQEIIPTILSRCHRLDFRRIPVLEIIAQLEMIVRKEHLAIEQEVLCTIAKASEGSLRDAESLLDQLVAFSRGTIAQKDVVAVLGMVEQEVLFAITNAVIHKNAQEALQLLNQVIDEGKDVGVLLDNLIEHVRNIMVAKITKADAKLIDLPQEACDAFLQQAAQLSLEEIFSFFNILVNTKETAKRLDSLRIPLEISLVKLAHTKKDAGGYDAVPKPTKSAAQEKKSITHPAASLKQEPSSVMRPKPPVLKAEEEIPPAQEVSQSVSLDAVKDAWQRIIDSLSKVRMSLATFLNEATVVKLEGRVLTLAFPKNYSLHKESLEKKENRAIVEQAIQEAIKVSLRANFILSKEINPKKEEQVNNPLVQSALHAFGARLIINEQ